MRGVVRVAGLAAVCAGGLGLVAAGVRAEGALVHVVQSGETLASIAERYYGDPRREDALVAENGLGDAEGVPITVGMRLTIPLTGFHRVGPGESWGAIAERYYGDARRAFVLVEANGLTGAPLPDAGAVLVVPYPLRFVARQNDSARDVAEELGLDVRVLRRFNPAAGARVQRGDVLLVPRANLFLSEAARAAVDAQPGPGARQAELRVQQARISAELPTLAGQIRDGHYLEAVALGSRLLGGEALTGNQLVTIKRELAVAYVALDRVDLAVSAFREALVQQPDLELDIARTSPMVLRALRQAREANARSPAGATPAGATPAGATPTDGSPGGAAARAPSTPASVPGAAPRPPVSPAGPAR